MNTPDEAVSEVEDEIGVPFSPRLRETLVALIGILDDRYA